MIELVVEGRAKDVGGLAVRRTLPVRERRHVGPFVFLDHMGPATLEAGEGIDVPPHPHIGLATVTWLIEGELLHRDSLGSAQTIVPGDVNWMSAGRGIVHSERTPAEARALRKTAHAIQAWVALPASTEDSEPTFQHHAAKTIPVVRRDGAELHVIAGNAYGATSPVRVPSPLFYVDAAIPGGGELALPDDHEERALHVVEGTVGGEGRSFGPGTLVVFERGVAARIHATAPARVMLLGGAPLEGERQIFWNFVATTKERIERAKSDWREGRFPKVPGDEHDFVPLP
ncbi:MAG TPA: pirin family protein [Planctomycetota bacterium]|nr:pirin family protein [Planctomycetota bacterium]